MKLSRKYRTSRYEHLWNGTTTCIKAKSSSPSTASSLKNHYTYAISRPRTCPRHSKVMKFLVKKKKKKKNIYIYMHVWIKERKSNETHMEIFNFLIWASMEGYTNQSKIKYLSPSTSKSLKHYKTQYMYAHKVCRGHIRKVLKFVVKYWYVLFHERNSCEFLCEIWKFLIRTCMEWYKYFNKS